MKRGHQTIIAIDLLRFACAAMVVAFHYGSAFAHIPGVAPSRFARGLPIGHDAIGATWFGWIGVELFFVISGIVIAASADRSTTWPFLRRRLLRLVPAVWICATITLLVLLVASPDPVDVMPWLRSMMFWPVGDQIDASYWTLGIEVYFYGGVALSLRRGRSDDVRHMALLLGAWSTIFWCVTSTVALPDALFPDAIGVRLALAPHGCFFALGILIQRFLTRRPTARELGVFALFLCTAVIEIRSQVDALGFRDATYIPVLIFLTGIALLLCSARVQPFLERTIGAGRAATMGMMTYPLYLIHGQCGTAVIGASLRAGTSYGAAVAAAVGAILVLAWTIARFGEPALRTRLDIALSRLEALTAPRVRSPDNPPNAFPPAG